MKAKCPVCGQEVESWGIKRVFGTIYAKFVNGTFCNAFQCPCGEIWGTEITREQEKAER